MSARRYNVFEKSSSVRGVHIFYFNAIAFLEISLIIMSNLRSILRPFHLPFEMYKALWDDLNLICNSR
jgi:hypothetical protein